MTSFNDNIILNPDLTYNDLCSSSFCKYTSSQYFLYRISIGFASSINIVIYDFSNTQFYLEYVEIGVFKGQEIEYQRFTTQEVELCLPSISLNEEVKFIDDHFNIDYTLNMNYDYSKASMVLQIEDGSEIYTKTMQLLEGKK